jgi:gamma-glutamyl hercynylcysteine S-oxide synthase
MQQEYNMERSPTQIHQSSDLNNQLDILANFHTVREHTLSLGKDLDYQTFSTQAHPDFSPIGWHLGHIAYIWDHWILAKYAGITLTSDRYKKLFAVDGLAKSDRVNLPTVAEVYEYLNLVGDRLLNHLNNYLNPELDFEQQKLWHWLIQHETQHSETIVIVRQLLCKSPILNRTYFPNYDPNANSAIASEPRFISVPSGYFTQGYDSLKAMDNESPAHRVFVDDFNICSQPVTQRQYRDFIDADGYTQKQYWSEAGWQWLQNSGQNLEQSQPLYTFGDDRSPVCGISWYEADAYCQFAQMRLPTESEWEKAADYLNLKGLVWEWTSTLFHPYPNFVPFPYSGYSNAYFDQAHFVLKGGSWASSAFTKRSPFRNWYYPSVRQIFAGLRCVQI